MEGINGLKIEEGTEGFFISHRAVIDSAATDLPVESYRVFYDWGVNQQSSCYIYGCEQRSICPLVHIKYPPCGAWIEAYSALIFF